MMGSRSCLIFFVLRVWYLQVPSEPGIRLHSAEDLESGFGDRIRHLGQEHPTGFLLCKALRRLESPVLVSDAIAGRWLRVYCGINVRTKVDNAAHLERDWAIAFAITSRMRVSNLEPLRTGCLPLWRYPCPLGCARPGSRVTGLRLASCSYATPWSSSWGSACALPSIRIALRTMRLRRPCRRYCLKGNLPYACRASCSGSGILNTIPTQGHCGMTARTRWSRLWVTIFGETMLVSDTGHCGLLWGRGAKSLRYPRRFAGPG